MFNGDIFAKHYWVCCKIKNWDIKFFFMEGVGLYD